MFIYICVDIYVCVCVFVYTHTRIYEDVSIITQ